MQYNEALRTVFKVGLILTCLIIPGTAGLEFRSVKSKDAPGAGDGKAREQAQTAKPDIEAGGEKTQQ